MKKTVVIGLLILSLMISAACGSSKPNQLNYPVEPFSFTNQDEMEVSLSDLQGKVWIADFIFTYCETVCPTMTANMAELQKRLKSADVEAELISFSVDPERDDPAALRSYLEKFDADFTNWSALTGYGFEEIKTFVLKSFKAPISKDGASDQVIHGTSFYLVDQSGTVVAKYDGMENTPYEKIIKDIKTLLR
ncbi:SCO family protein [Paenibacillus oralis]|uniref:SCO family protein n=1 Tax=Paenibacillus oralis TaxID=2490856 RepID=A0A3P3UCD3_9BACL|nr:SCO family protein [Paenibacillus oralis]RRJ67288.1 SCO family protein [Paenibacillus oralis]